MRVTVKYGRAPALRNASLCYANGVRPDQHIPRIIRPTKRPMQTLLARMFWALALVVVAWVLLWFQRDGLHDSAGGDVGAMDVLYFTIVTVTTLGYGDIVPATPEARAMVAFGITPLRIAIWLILLSTAYELLLRRSIEIFDMKKLHRSLKDHFVICGFGVKGRSAAAELLKRGIETGSIVVIDKDSAALEGATALGLTGIRGDASTERALRDAAIEKATQAIVVPDRDEACVLICLTIHDIAPHVNIIAAAREDENVRLIRGSGAQVVIAPAASGGRLLAAASTSPYAASMMEELYEYGRGADIYDYPVTLEDIGKTAPEVEALHGRLILAVQSGDQSIRQPAAQSHGLKIGDVVIVFSPAYLRAE